ncbi:hypothetical protein [Cryptosporangium sp. NPDC048952]|uniref:hypothetical protein n=1 Tax=Cryptosporangium sp. NPDC048952 TaxID=3363961 RepID=UPI00371FCC29
MDVRIAAALAGLMLVAACGADEPPAARTPPPSPPPSPSPSPSPPPLAAADGTRYAACWDGTCEVAVSRPTTIPIRFGKLSVSKLQPDDGITFDITLPGGGGSGTLKGNCGVIGYFYRDFSGGHMSASACPSTAGPADVPTPKPAPGEIGLQLVGWTPTNAAVLRLASGS